MRRDEKRRAFEDGELFKKRSVEAVHCGDRCEKTVNLLPGDAARRALVLVELADEIEGGTGAAARERAQDYLPRSSRWVESRSAEEPARTTLMARQPSGSIVAAARRASVGGSRRRC